MKRRMMVIGIGAGNPEYVTVQAIKAMNRVSVFFIPNKGTEKAGLAQLRQEICERYIEGANYRLVDFDVPERSRAGGYKGDVEAWRNEVRRVYETLLATEMGEGEIGAFLVWGDPSLYDGTLAILESIRTGGRFELDYDVIPGISSIQALAAQHRVPLNRIGESLTVTTGRLVAEGLPKGAGNVVVMLDNQAALTRLDGDIEIYWGAYVGMDDEILVSGRLGEVGDEIERIRATSRTEHGWVMDTYLLSRQSEDGDE